MKRALLAFAAVVLVVSGAVVYRSLDACHDWQDRYKRFLYAEMMKNSPRIYHREEIEEIIGEAPSGCGLPSPPLGKADIERFRREGVGPNEFRR